MRKASFVQLASLGAAVALLSAAPVLAGEVTGNGKPTAAPDHAASACAYSGQNDGNPPPGRVQSFGAFLNYLSALFGFRVHPADAPNHPSVGCNPN